MGTQEFLYCFIFLRCEPAFAGRFFLVDTFVLTAFRIAVLVEGGAFEPERSSFYGCAGSFRQSLSSPFSAFTACSRPAAIVFETNLVSVPHFVAILFSSCFVCWRSRRIAGNLAELGGGIHAIHLQFRLLASEDRLSSGP